MDRAVTGLRLAKPRKRARVGTTPCKWTNEQNEQLRKSVEFHGEKNWKAIALAVPGRTSKQCLQRWKKALKPGLRKGHWSEEEDCKLIRAVKHGQSTGVKHWGDIALFVPGRTSKQVRERWCNHLDPDIRTQKWTSQEDKLLKQLHETYGNQWAKIAREMPGRPEEAVKMRYRSLYRHKKHEDSDLKAESIINITKTETVATQAQFRAACVPEQQLHLPNNFYVPMPCPRPMPMAMSIPMAKPMLPMSCPVMPHTATRGDSHEDDTGGKSSRKRKLVSIRPATSVFYSSNLLNPMSIWPTTIPPMTAVSSTTPSVAVNSDARTASVPGGRAANNPAVREENYRPEGQEDLQQQLVDATRSVNEHRETLAELELKIQRLPAPLATTNPFDDKTWLMDFENSPFVQSPSHLTNPFEGLDYDFSCMA